MKKRLNHLLDIVFRYTILILIGIFSLEIFYFLFTYLTIYPTYFLLRLFFDASLTNNVILINSLPIEIIGSCIAGSAYYLLLILTLSTREITIKKRFLMLLFSFGMFLIINISRLFFLSVLYVNGVSSFDITHKLFWYVGSVFFIVVTWFLSVKIFNVKEIPFYSDIVFLLKSRKNLKKTKRSKKH
jgi:exosortase/archaeosortase family protein